MARLQLHTETKTLPFGVSVDIVMPQCPRNVKPEAYYTEENKLPVLFLLHGGGGAESDWLRFTRLEQLVEDRQICIVCPGVQNSSYTNMYRGYRWFDYVSQELYDYVHAVLPVSRERGKNFVAGLSMGGYGALRLGLQCPEKFGYIAALSSAVEITEQVAENRCPLPGNGLSIYGPAASVRGSENDLYHTARELIQSGRPVPKIYDACGTEDFTYAGNVAYRDLLLSLGYDVTWRESPGVHNWAFWDEYIEYILDWLPL